MTETTYKWGEAPGEFKSEKAAQRAKTQQKVKSRKIRKVTNRPTNLLRAMDAIDRSFSGKDRFSHMRVNWTKIAQSAADTLRKLKPKVGPSIKMVGGGGGKSLPGTKVEIPKKLTRNY